MSDDWYSDWSFDDWSLDDWALDEGPSDWSADDLRANWPEDRPAEWYERLGKPFDVWRVDLHPLPCLPSDREAIPVLCALQVFVFEEFEVGTSPGADPDGIADLLATIVQKLIAKTDVVPRVVETWTEPVRAALADRLAHHGIEVRAAEDVAFISARTREAIAELAGEDWWPPAARPNTWSTWEHPPERIAELFRAAADYRRTALSSGGGHGLELVTVTNGGRWLLASRGGGDLSPSLSLWSKPTDFMAAYEARLDGERTPAPLGPRIDLAFRPLAELPSEMRKEVLQAGWAVADPSAYPVLSAFRTPGAGLPAPMLEDLIAILRSIARRSARFGDEAPADRWFDGDTLVFFARPGLDVLRGGPGAWEPDAPIAPAGPRGSGADLGARLDPPEEDVLRREVEALLDRFARWLAVEMIGDLSDEPGEGGEESWEEEPEEIWDDPYDDFDRAMEAADHFGSYLVSERIPVTAVHELDLRNFLMSHVLTSPGGGRPSERVAGELCEFFNFLRREEGVHCPWAHAILLDRISLAAFARGIHAAPDEDEIRNVQMQGARFLAHHSLGRGFIPPSLTSDSRWSRSRGPREGEVYRDIRARWLVWREELVAAGVTTLEELMERLSRRRDAWAATPHPAHGRSPLDVVLEERRQR